MIPTAAMTGERRIKGFHTDASAVMGALRTRIADVLSELGNFSRPAEVQKALDLDKTLGRQVFKLACTAEALGNGGVIPSRTSMRRFLNAAKDRGIDGESVEGVWSAYEVFERLIETHAGDRVTFNSMVSAAADGDADWSAADAQHRRNSFRAMSHTVGVQAKTRLQLFIVDEGADASTHALAMVTGYIGLRVLRPLPSVRVFGTSVSGSPHVGRVSCEPIGLSDGAEGYLLERFSTPAAPTLRSHAERDEGSQWREVVLDNPEVGKTGASTVMFGNVYRNVPTANEPLRLQATAGKPAEVLLFDVLSHPGLAGTSPPVGRSVLGLNERFGGEQIDLKGKFDPRSLGRGPEALATPEVPGYDDMIRAVATKLGWDVKGFNAWRIRVEFPLYQSTVTMTWDPRRLI